MEKLSRASSLVYGRSATSQLAPPPALLPIFLEVHLTQEEPLVNASAGSNDAIVGVLTGTTGQNSRDVFGGADVAATDECPVATHQDYRLASFAGVGGGNRER
jgi:hypothetical protein